MPRVAGGAPEQAHRRIFRRPSGYHSGMDVGAHVSQIAGRTETETSRLAARLARWAWPTAGVDRANPGAIEWVRRWGPSRGLPAPVTCSCAAGRCRVCN